MKVKEIDQTPKSKDKDGNGDDHHRARSAEYSANWLSLATFHWPSPLLRTAFRRPIQYSDIPQLHPRNCAPNYVARLKQSFRARRANGDSNPLWWALYSAFATEFWLGGLCRGTADVLLVLVPFLSRHLIQFVIDSYVVRRTDGKDEPPLAVGIGYVVGIAVMLTVQSLAHNHYMYLLAAIGCRSKTALVSAIFEKSGNMLQTGATTPQNSQRDRQPPASDEASNKESSVDESGYIVNLVSVDCSRIEKTVGAIHMLWTAPLSLMLAIALLIYNLRVSALAGLGFLLLCFAGLIGLVGVLFSKRKAIDKIARERTSLLQEVLAGIRLLKLFAWEAGLAKQINAIRKRETRGQYRYGSLRTFTGAVSQALPVTTAMMTFIVYSLTGHGLSPAIVFSSTALFTCLRMPLIYLPLCAQACIDAWASLMRIERFLSTEENVSYPIETSLDVAVILQDATFSWDLHDKSKPSTANLAAGGIPRIGHERLEEASASTTTFATTLSLDDASFVDSRPLTSSSAPLKANHGFSLRDIDMTIKRGELVAVIGSVGSGKTSLLSALTGNMPKTSGTVTWGTSYVACAQQPWIMSGTVRENITFGLEWNQARYNRVVMAASLVRDFSILPHGDQTAVGERGVVLSGGQRQRIALARAMYSRSECVLLDDPLSAVDANVGRSLLDDAICGFMHERTRLLCTHNTDVLRRCDRVLWIEDGFIRQLDTYQKLMDTDPSFVRFVHRGSAQAVSQDETQTNPTTSCDQHKDSIDNTHSSPDHKSNKIDTLIQEEEHTAKAVSWSVYAALISPPRSLILFLLCIPFLLVGNASTVITQLWLSWWSANKYDLPRNAYIAIYVALAFAQLLFIYSFGVLLHLACAHSTQRMFRRAVWRLLGAPVSFFDSTPLGRHMNRLTSDVDKMDNALPDTLRLYAISMTGLIPIFAIQITYYNWFGIAVAVLIAALLALALYYRSAARETERFEAVFRSTVLARIVEGLSGAPTLQAYGMYSIFTSKLHDALDQSNTAALATVAVQRWLSLRQDAAAVLAMIALGSLILAKRFTQHPAISGVVLSLMISAIQVIQVVVREWAEMEAAMNCTERLHAYANDIPSEEDGEADADLVDDDGVDHESAWSLPRIWPTAGGIEFSNVSMKYRSDLPESLKNVSLSIRTGERVAIVGRTGAGKSSIVNALFRFVPLCAGSILIDHQDIANLSLHKLRNTLAIIPQETTLFSGTVRSNLDPFSVHNDGEMNAVLRQTHLAGRLSLSDPIRAQGANLSVGQRQLLALARVMLRRQSKILVCDEATSSLDAGTDDLIQRTMRTSDFFRAKTILCIAHRLRTVLWYDRICVMDEGRAVAIGSPHELWQMKDGIFRSMCDKAGITSTMIEDARSEYDHIV